MKPAILILAIAACVIAGCGNTTSSPETGTAAAVACLKHGGATQVKRGGTGPFTSISAVGTGHNIIMLTTSNHGRPSFLSSKRGIVEADPTALFWKTNDGRAFAGTTPNTSLKDWSMIVDCASRLPENANLDKALNAADLKLMAQTRDAARIENACGMGMDTAGRALVDLAAAGNAPLRLIRRLGQLAAVAAESAENDPNSEWCPELRKRAGLIPYPHTAQFTGNFNCDYLLGSGAAGPYTFVAGGVVTNTGGKAGTATVEAVWELLGSDPANATESVFVPPGGRKRVQISRPAQPVEIDAHQSANSRCHVNVKAAE